MRTVSKEEWNPSLFVYKYDQKYIGEQESNPINK
jgi:hypothetical protein